jgi:hypothetical protein
MFIVDFLFCKFIFSRGLRKAILIIKVFSIYRADDLYNIWYYIQNEVYWGYENGVEMKIYATSIKVDMPLKICHKNFFLSIDSIKKIVYNKNRNEKLSLL